MHDNSMRRRRLLKQTGVIGAVSLAGCMGDEGTPGGNGTPDGEDTPVDDGGELDFPNRNMQMIVPFGPGGGFDTYARLVAKHMDVPEDVIVANIEGAEGQIAMENLFRADPDGHTMMIVNVQGHSQTQLIEDVDWDLRDATVYPQVVQNLHTINVGANTGIDDFSDFVEAVDNGEVKFGTSSGRQGTGFYLPFILGRLSGLFDEEMVEENWVNFPGKAEWARSIERGDVQVMVGSHSSTYPFVEQGIVKRIAVLTMQDSPPMGPDVPTFGNLEDDIPSAQQIIDLNLNRRVFIGTPGVPDERADYLREKMTEAIQSDELQQDAEDAGRAIQYGDSERAEQALHGALDTWEENMDLLEVIAGEE